MQKIFFYILAIALVILVSLPQFWNYVYGALPSNDPEISQLSFRSLFGDYKIYIDAENIGTVKDKQSQVFTKINSGEKTVKIIRESSVNDFYYVFERKINFYPGTQVDIEWESGPTLESSNGTIRYFGPGSNKDGTELNIISFPTNSEVEINSQISTEKSILVKDTKPIKIRVKNTDIYENRELEVVLTSVRPNLVHTVEVYLYKKPFVQE